LTTAAPAPVLEKCIEAFVTQEFSAPSTVDIAAVNENRSAEISASDNALFFI
jgi:hypothetical protein